MNRIQLLFVFTLFAAGTLCARNEINMAGDTLIFDELIDYKVTMDGRSELHLTGDVSSVSGTIFNILCKDSWIFFHEIWPADVHYKIADQIFVNGEPAVPDENMRFEQYRHGTVIIPHSSCFRPLVLYSGENFSGTADSLELYAYYRENELGEMNNQVSSFRLNRGYMATFAQDEKGMGYSRVFIACDDHLEVPLMSEGLDNSVSFIRVFPWKYVSKKGWGGGGTAPRWDLMQFTWQYNWNANSTSQMNYEYVPIRHNYWWPGWDLINTIENSTHVLGYNEPERSDQADMTVEQGLELWPRLMESGMRLGSPAPSDAAAGREWLYEFIDRADELNYRVDYVSMHWYQGNQTPRQFYNRLRQVHERTGRPIWIKEFNNGANWTAYPDPQESALWFEEVLQMLDTASFVERYAVFHWMADPFRMYIDGQLTAAGKVYSNHKAGMAYHPDNEFVMEYVPVPPPVNLQATLLSAGIRITWIDHVIGKYGLQVERSVNGEPFGLIADVDDLKNQVFIDTDPFTGGASYRLRLYKDSLFSVWSEPVRIYAVNQEVPYAIDHNASGRRLSFSESEDRVILEDVSVDGQYSQKWRLVDASSGLYYLENVAGNVRLLYDPDDGVMLVPRTSSNLNARWRIESAGAAERWHFIVHNETGRKLHARHQDNFRVGTTDGEWSGVNVQWKLIQLDALPPGIIVDVRSNNPQYGQVTGGGYYEHGEKVTIRAIPNTDHRFLYWREGTDIISKEVEYTFAADEDNRLFVASFGRSVFTITFRIFDEFETPVQEAIVALNQTQNDPGDYIFENVKPGIYEVVVVKPGYKIHRETIEVTEDDAVVEVVLQEDDTGVDDAVNPFIHAYPVPVKDVLNVSFFHHGGGHVKITLMDIHQQVVASHAKIGNGIHEVRFDTSSMPSGFYILRLDRNGVTETKKIMVQ